MVREGLGSPLLGLANTFLVLRFPGMVDLQPAVELLSACSQQLDIFKEEEMREIVRRKLVPQKKGKKRKEKERRRRSKDQDIN